MLSKTRGMPVYSAAPGVIPDTITGPVSNASRVATGPDVAPVQDPLRRRTTGRRGASTFAARPTGADFTATRSEPSRSSPS
jgi:hypothetical protein